MSLFRATRTTLDLNGPNLYFSTQPVGVATSTSSSGSISGFASAYRPVIEHTKNFNIDLKLDKIQLIPDCSTIFFEVIVQDLVEKGQPTWRLLLTCINIK